MNPALQKTITFLLLILAGFLLQKKISGKQDLNGVKVLILSVILPATIFIALLKIKVAPGMFGLPVLALGLNFLLYYAAALLLPYLGFAKDSKAWRTMLLLVPSLAPGLSCMPFLLEYLGEDALAISALADVGNKLFVLVFLYLVAMHWFYRMRGTDARNAPDRKSKLKDLGLSLLREPVNVVIVVAILMLTFGLNATALPEFLSDTVVRLAGLMTPLVLLFIGMAVRFERREMTMILRVLVLRSGLAFLFSGIFLLLAPAMAPAMALLAVAFPQSAISFWPFAHMSAVEAQLPEGKPSVFDTSLALNVLACSLPFSTVIMLGVLSAGTTFANPWLTITAGGVLLAGPLLFALRTNWARAFRKVQRGPQVQQKVEKQTWSPQTSPFSGQELREAEA